MNNVTKFDRGFRYEQGENFIVESKSARLRTTPTQEESIEGCRAAIDESNRRAVRLGYDAQQWMIIHRFWNCTYSPNETFKESNEKKVFVEFYPRELTIDVREAR